MESVLTFEQWNLDFQEASAAIAHAKATVRRGTGFWIMALRLWDSVYALRRIVRMHELLERSFKGITGAETDLAQLLKSTLELVSAIDGLLEVCANRRLTNRSLTGAPLESIRKYGIEIRDFTERLQMSIDPGLRDDIAEALEEYRRGETVSLEELR